MKGIQTKARIASLDLAKIIAMLGVIALHTQRCLSTGVLYNPVLYYGSRFCMPVFFMINGYLILGKSDFGFIYYKKKIFNIIRILIIWSAFGFFYSLLLKGDSLYLALRNTAKVLIGHYIVPTWFLFTFVVIYTILLFGFNRIKKNIVLLKTLIISKKPGNTGKSRDKDTEFTTHLLHSEGALTRCPFP
ncbi:acyltransferase family protein [Eisenbergiella porci]|uniref:acyltransferase family protein n=1 Tax=Eisenbergiella porci TaxID=2652274 RepID=UPI002A83152C|nr:acyltransferase family protein [Eisenbergiella porci]